MTTDDGVKIDPAVVQEWHETYAADLEAFLLGVLRHRESVAETLQATFVKALESGHQAREKTVRGWLFRVAHNEAMQLKRKLKLADEKIKNRSLIREFLEQPDDAAIRQEDVHKIGEALKKLPQEHYIVVKMRIFEDKKFAVIAEELGIPLGTVLTRMRTALKMLSRTFSTEQ